MAQRPNSVSPVESSDFHTAVRPTAARLAGAFFALVGLLSVAKGSPSAWMFVVVGAVVGLFAKGWTLDTDGAARLVVVTEGTLVRRSEHLIPFDDVGGIDLLERRGRNSSARVLIRCEDGASIQVRLPSSRRADEIAARLRRVIGLDPVTAPAPPEVQATSSSSKAGRSGGVDWTTSIVGDRTLPVTRWVSNDATLTDGFVALVQQTPGAGGWASKLAGGEMAAMRLALLRYGHSEDEIPPEHLLVLPLGFDDLGDRFRIVASSSEVATQVMLPEVVETLREWGESFPLQARMQFGQGPLEPPAEGFISTAASFGPRGTIVSSLGVLSDRHLELLVPLGVALVNAQRRRNTTAGQ